MDSLSYFKDRMIKSEYQRVEAMGEFTNIFSLLKFCEEQYGDTCAYRYYKEEEYSQIKKGSIVEINYRTVSSDCRTVWELLSGKGIEPGTKVGLYLNNNYNFITAFLGIVSFGCTAVLIPVTCSVKAAIGLLMSTDTMFLIAEDEFISELNSECNDSKCCNIELISSIYISEYVVKNHMLTDVKFNNRTIEDRTIDNRIIDDRTIIDNGIKADIINKDTTAVVLFTAGTTEHSKGVVLTHGNLLRSAKNGCYINGTVFQMNYLALIPFTHVFGLVRNLLTSIYSQSTMFLCESMKYMIRDIQLAKPNILVLVPALAQMLYGIILSRGIEAVGGELTTIICGGAPVPEELIMNYQKIDIMIQPGYGLSEAAGMVCGNMEAAEYPLSVGVLFPDGEWKIVNQELYIRGDHVMHSYYGQNGIDENGWFHTGDLGYFDKEGRLYLTGRSKNVIITDNGYSVSPEEIETVVDKLPYVSASIATEGTDEIGNKIIVIHIVATKAAKEDYSKAQLQEMLQEDINKLNRIFPLHMQIRKIKLRDEDFMRNGSLKIIRRGLE